VLLLACAAYVFCERHLLGARRQAAVGDDRLGDFDSGKIVLCLLG
jgi:hypothetical protein